MQTLNAAVMVTVRKGLVIVMVDGEGTFVTSLLKSVGLVPQAQSVIVPMVFVCVACHPVRGKKAKVSKEAVVETKAKARAKVMVAPPHWVTFQAKQTRQQPQPKVQTNKLLI